MTKIALFSDGTGNSSSSPRKTNVWRAYHALDLSEGSSQVAFYDNGVGTSSFTPTAVLGLAFGWGLARNVRQIYGFLCRTYKPGDEIYAFGFSRGAFTIRVAVGLIASQGIIDRKKVQDEREMDRWVTAAYNEFRKESFTPSFLSFFLRPVRDVLLRIWHGAHGRRPYQPETNIGYRRPDDGLPPDDEPLIKFVGVWDTVDAYGLPIDELTRAWDKVVWPLTANDRTLSTRVGRACHALALDEQRESFEPMLWNEKGTTNGDERVLQVWFPGVHSDVGGGYPDDGLAFTALQWMLTESEKDDGLQYLSQERNRYRADSKAPLNDSRRSVGNLYRYAPRHLERLCKMKKPGLANWLKDKLPNRFKGKSIVVNRNEVDITRPKIHHSVFDRLVESGHAYAPINIPEDYDVVTSSGAVITNSRENKQQAARRKANQTLVWTKVWRRKLLYLVTLIAVVWFIFYPIMATAPDKGELGGFARAVEPYLGTFGQVVRAIPDLVGKIPGLGFIESWAASYGNFPFKFALGIIVIGGLLAWSTKLNAALKGEMRVNWHHLTGTGSPPPGETGAFRRWLASFLEGKIYTNRIEKPLRIALEAIGVVLFLLIAIAVCSRLYFISLDGLGAVCEPDSSLQDRRFGKAFVFNQQNHCDDTGLELTAGSRYAIELEVSGWADDTIEADVNGWRPGAAPWYMNLFTPVRRHLFVDWYQPVARVGEKLFDRYPLRASEAQPETDEVMDTMCMTFEARRTGQLYLYLNDAMFFTSGFFYKNNKGSAKVLVRKLDRSEQGCAQDPGSQ